MQKSLLEVKHPIALRTPSQYLKSMFPILEKIDKGLTTKARCTLMDKSGRHYHGVFEDSWIRISGGKLRGKAVFISEEKGRIEIEAYDILDVLLPKAE